MILLCAGELTAAPHPAEPLPLEEAANSSFIDRNPEDRRDGWLDLGSLYDLRALPSGPLRTSFGSFQIIDAARNNGKSCIILGGGPRPGFPREATQKLRGARLKTLLLLHAAAWPLKEGELGSIWVRFTDGATLRIPVRFDKEVGNWWNPADRPNARIGWKERNDENEMGLYVSCFMVPELPIDSLRFVSSGKAVWMIAAIAGSPDLLTPPGQQPYTVRRNDDWRELRFTRDVESGSALDFSFRLDAPAGKYGFVRAVGDHFEFEHRRGAIRFYGANLCNTANYMSHAEADELAERLSRIGYNAIRLHHYDIGLIAPQAKDSLTFDPEQLDRLDYLFAALKKRGIYLTLDLFSYRARKPGEFASLPNLRTLRDYKLAAMLSPEVNANLKTFARRFLTRVNPYTGLRYADDPAIVGICGINENMIFSLYDKLAAPAAVLCCDRLFAEECRERGITVTPENRPAELRRFLHRRYQAYWSDMVKFLRGLGVRAPLTELNHRQPPLAADLREAFDYVDNHIYWEHPRYLGVRRGKPPIQIRNTSVLAADLWPVRMLAPSRLLNKPFTVSEFDFCYPNEFRAEGAVLFAAFAAFQNWSGLYRFEYSGNYKSLTGTPYMTYFTVGTDPIRLLSERIGTLFFTRGDIAPGRRVVPVPVRPGEFEADYVEQYPPAAQKLALRVRTGTVLDPAPAPLPVLPPVADGVEVSSTGELSVNWKQQSFSAAGRGSEALVLPEHAVLSGKYLQVHAVKGFSTAAALALDGAELPDSGRILLLHLTDVRPEGLRYYSAENQIVLAEPPPGPLLGRHGIAEFSLKTASPALRLYPLSLSGKRHAPIPFEYRGGILRFTADTFRLPGDVVFAYELIREK